MQKYIQQLIFLFGSSDYSTTTRKQMQQWLADEEHADEKNEALHKLWMQAAAQEVPVGMSKSILRMQQSIGVRPYGKKKSYQQLIWRAAVILLLALSSVSLYLTVEKERPEVDLVECYIPTADIRELTLPDGTRVMLNSQSTLLYPEYFTGKTRSVYLIGEANFKVRPDKTHPFIVKVNDLQVTALGTEFNICAYPDNEELAATLLEGSVKVEFNKMTADVMLKPNDQLVYNKQTKVHKLQQPDISDITAWQRGELVFSKMYLEDIFTHLERKYPYTFVYSPNNLKANTYSFRFPKQATLEEVMTIITQVAGDVRYMVRGDKCYVTTR